MDATLFIIRGENADEGQWVQYIIARSPGEALDIATTRHTWSVLSPLSVEMPLDFIDATAVPIDSAGKDA